MWRDICVWNKANLVGMIEVFERRLQQLKHLIQAGDGPGLEREFERAKQTREQLK